MRFFCLTQFNFFDYETDHCIFEYPIGFQFNR